MSISQNAYQTQQAAVPPLPISSRPVCPDCGSRLLGATCRAVLDRIVCASPRCDYQGSNPGRALSDAEIYLDPKMLTDAILARIDDLAKIYEVPHLIEYARIFYPRIIEALTAQGATMPPLGRTVLLALAYAKVAFEGLPEVAMHALADVGAIANDDEFVPCSAPAELVVNSYNCLVFGGVA